MSELTEKLMSMYEKQNTPRLVRKVTNLERANAREFDRNLSLGIIMSVERANYYSHRLYVLEEELIKRGVIDPSIEAKAH